MKIALRLTGLACLVSLNCAVISVASAQSPTPTPSQTPTPTATPSPSPSPPPPSDGSPTAAITFPDDTSLSVWSAGGLFPVVTTLPGVSLNIQVQFPLTLANTPLIVEVLDGGVLSSGQDELIIGFDGTASIQFQVASQAGSCPYRVLLYAGGQITILRFQATLP